MPSYPPFDCDREEISLRWTKWIRRLDHVFTGQGIKNSNQKKALLLCLGGEGVNDIYDSLPISREDPPASFEAVVSISTHSKTKSSSGTHSGMPNKSLVSQQRLSTPD